MWINLKRKLAARQSPQRITCTVSLHTWNRRSDVQNMRFLEKRLLNANYITRTIESIAAKIDVHVLMMV
jgi:hypothetical protein